MDQLKPLGKDIAESAGPTFGIYANLLNQSSVAADINATHRETFTYGSHAKQKLDLYTAGPDHAAATNGTPRPVLVFVHGGGMFSGDRILPDFPGELVHKNMGHFFADKCGVDFIVAGYRLIQDGAKYPSGGEDLMGVLEWAEKHYASEETGGGKRDLFLLGNSAGGVHVATWFLSKHFRAQREKLVSGTAGVQLKGVVFVGCPFRWELAGGLKDVLVTYYGSEDQVKRSEPTSLLKQAVAEESGKSLSEWPKVLVAVSEFDPEEGIEVPSKEFCESWSAAKGKETYLEVKGHNHISPPLALGTDIAAEEAWGFDIAKWMSS